jgi:hypothetical protein
MQKVEYIIKEKYAIFMWDITYCTFISKLLKSTAGNTLQPSNFYYVLPLDRGYICKDEWHHLQYLQKRYQRYEHVAVNLSINGWNKTFYFCCTISYRLAVIFDFVNQHGTSVKFLLTPTIQLYYGTNNEVCNSCW